MFETMCYRSHMFMKLIDVHINCRIKERFLINIFFIGKKKVIIDVYETELRVC